MSFTVHLDPGVNCAFIKHKAPFDIDNLAKSAGYRLTHPDFQKNMNFLHDFTDLVIPKDTKFAVLSETSKQIIQDYNHLMGSCKGALVVGDSVSYAKIHQFIESGRFDKNPVDRKVFNDLNKAFEWLEIPQDYEIKFT